MQPVNNTADTGDAMDIDEQSPVMRPTAAFAVGVEFDQEMLDAEMLIAQGGRASQIEEAEDGEAVVAEATVDVEEDPDDDEDPLADLEAAAERDDLQASGDLQDPLANQVVDTEEVPVYMHIVEKTGATPTSKFVQVEYDPNAIQVTIDFNQIVPRITNNITRPNLDTVHLAQGLSDEEILLGHVAHPDDIAGSLLLRIAPTLSTMELAERVNALYYCCKLQLNSNNAITQRIALAGDALGRRNGWSKEETATEKARVKNARPNAHSTAIPVRQYTFLNRPAGEEAPQKTNWTKPQLRKGAAPGTLSLSTRNRRSTARNVATLPPAPQPEQDEEVVGDETALEEPGDSDDAFTAEELEAGQAHDDPALAALYQTLAERKETYDDLKRQLKDKESGDNA